MKLLNLFIDLLFPVECLGCSKEGQYLCPECLTKIPINHDFICPFCGHSSFLGQVCFNCREKVALDGVWWASDYKNEILRDCIKAFKIKLVRDLKDRLSEILFRYLLYLVHDKQIDLDFDWVMPVPLHYRKYLERGFNQSEVLAQEISQGFDLSVETEILKRHKFRRPQMKLKEKKRLKNVIGVFKAVDREGILIDKKILLIDDVMTTGTTLNECAKVLKQAGAREVWALALAKT